MRARAWTVAVLLSSMLLGCEALHLTRPKAPALASPRSTEELIGFVEKAAAEVRTKGTAAFDGFAAKGTVWNHDDTYVFVVDAKTNKVVFHGADPTRVGTDLTTVTGAEGRPFGRWSIRGLAGKLDHTWVFYKRERPGGGKPVWKASYLLRTKGPSGQRYIVGSGVYDLEVDRRLVTELVDIAAERIGRDGRTALQHIRDPQGPFVYADTHVFVIDTKGTVLADALYPELEGKNQIDLKSADGRPVQRELVRLIQTENAGWRTGYLWPRPGGGPPGHRDIYMKKVRLGRQVLGVGSGLYVD